MLLISCTNDDKRVYEANNGANLELSYAAYVEDAQDGKIDDIRAYSHIGVLKGTIEVIAESVADKTDVILVDPSFSNYYYYQNNQWFISLDEMGLDRTTCKYMISIGNEKTVSYSYLSYEGFNIFKRP